MHDATCRSCRRMLCPVGNQTNTPLVARGATASLLHVLPNKPMAGIPHNHVPATPRCCSCCRWGKTTPCAAPECGAAAAPFLNLYHALLCCAAVKQVLWRLQAHTWQSAYQPACMHAKQERGRDG